MLPTLTHIPIAECYKLGQIKIEFYKEKGKTFIQKGKLKQNLVDSGVIHVSKHKEDTL